MDNLGHGKAHGEIVTDYNVVANRISKGKVETLSFPLAAIGIEPTLPWVMSPGWEPTPSPRDFQDKTPIVLVKRETALLG